ncbi:hypothetical protein NONI108955_35190 [Nocardia ninae]
MVPLVEGAGLVDAFIALQADEVGGGRGGDGFGELGFAHTGRPLDQEGFAEVPG